MPSSVNGLVSRVAVVQAGSVIYNTAATLDKMDKFVEEAARERAELVLFPEAFIGGYPKTLDFGVNLGLRSEEGREEFAKYFASSITEKGEEAKRIGKTAKKYNVWIAIGVVERDGSTLYCSVFIFSSSGDLVCKHRKLLPTGLERCVWGRGDGSTMKVVDSPVGRLATAICWENYMPLYRTSLYAQGCEVYLAPTVDCRDVWLPSMQMIALEGRSFVVSACQFLRVSDFPDGHSIRSNFPPEHVLISGGSCAVDPLGRVLLQPDFSGEMLRIVQIDHSLIPKARFDMDVSGHYSRPDIFQLVVNHAEQKNLVTLTNNH